MANQLSLDDQAAMMAEKMMKGGAAGDMPTGRGGGSGAEGGFTPQAGGKVIDADAAEKAGSAIDDDGMALGKSGPKTGADMTSEPGRQGNKPQTGADMTSEPGKESGGGAGDGGNLAQGGDEAIRARKAGKVGVSGGGSAEAGKNLSEDGDAAMRARKAEEEDEDEDGMDKGLISPDDLIKSLETLEAVSQGSTVQAPADRRADLGQKLSEGTLSKSEMTELAELMKASVGSAADDEDELSKSDDADEWEHEDEALDKSYSEQFAGDSEMSEAYEVSNFLERHSQLTAGALDQMQNKLSKSLGGFQDRTQAYNTQLAKSLMGMAQLAQRQESLIKSLVDRLEHVENTPLPRKGLTRVSAMHKSMPDEVGAGQAGGLSRSQVMDALEQMAMRGIQQTPSGFRVDYAMAQIEHNPAEKIAKSLYGDVETFIQSNNGSVRVQ